MDPFILPIFLFAMIALMLFTGIKNRKRQQEKENMLSNEVKPGVWVRTIGGFYGIVADIDGEVVVLQTTDGTETLWDRRVIVEVTEPPFADEENTVTEPPAEPTNPVQVND